LRSTARSTASAAGVALAAILGVGAASVAVDAVRIPLRASLDDRAAAWTSSEHDRVERAIAGLTPAIDAVRASVSADASVWAWSTTENAGIYDLFFQLQTLVYPRALWTPDSAARLAPGAIWNPGFVALMTRPSIPSGAPPGSGAIVLHLPGEEDAPSASPPAVDRGRWRAVRRTPIANVFVLDAAP